MRKVLLALAGTSVVVLSIAFLFRGELATAIMARAAERALAADRIAELPDGLHVLFCGAGSPLPDPRRSGPCVAVIAGRTLVVVDAGSNGVRNLQRMGFRAGGIQALFLTHFHSDHIDGLGELAMQRWVGDAHTDPLPVYGPPGVEQIVDGFNLAYRADFGYRTAHHGEAVAPPSGAGTVAHAYTLPAPGAPGAIWDRDGLLVEAFAVDHEPAHPAVGYRFAYGGRTLVISGDTRKIDEVADVAQDADLLVHEALAPQLVARLTSAAEHAGQAGLAKITRDIVDYHTSPVQAAELASTANVAALVLYHIVPPLLVPGAEAAFVRNVSDVYAGPVTVARDGTLVSLPAATERIEYDQRL